MSPHLCCRGKNFSNINIYFVCAQSDRSCHAERSNRTMRVSSSVWKASSLQLKKESLTISLILHLFVVEMEPKTPFSIQLMPGSRRKIKKTDLFMVGVKSFITPLKR